MENLVYSNRIFTYREATSEGFTFVFIDGNRSLSAKNVTAKVATLKEFGTNLMPIMVVDAAKAIEEGCTLVNPSTKAKVLSGYEKMLAILDGQHRFSAAKDAGVLENLHFFMSYSNAKAIDQLATCNSESKIWNGADYAHCAATYQPDNKVANFISDLSDRGFQTATIGLILYQKGGCITATSLSKMIKGAEPKEGYDLDLANYFLEKAKDAGFTDQNLSSRYVINAVLSITKKHGFLAACDKLATITAEQRKFFLESKAAVKEQYLANILSA